MRTKQRMFGLLAVGLTAALLAVATPPASADLPATTYDQLFFRVNQPQGFTQGDGARSFGLPDGRSAWLFGDSSVDRLSTTWPGSDGTPRRVKADGTYDNSYVNNQVATTRPGTSDFTTYYGGTSASPTSFIPPDASGHRFYPDAGIVEPWFGQTIARVFVTDIDAAHTRKVLGLGSSSLATYETSGAIPAPTYTDGTVTDTIDFGDALLNDGGYTYIYGNWHYAQKTFVARTPIGHLADFASWQYFSTGATWSSSTSALAPSADRGVNSIVKSAQGYLLFLLRWNTNTSDPLRRTIQAFRAPTPAGPWTTTGSGAQPAVWSYAVPADGSVPTATAPRQPFVHSELHSSYFPNLTLLSWIMDTDRVGGATDPANLYEKWWEVPHFLWIDLTVL